MHIISCQQKIYSLMRKKSGGNYMDIQQDFSVDKNIVKRLILRILMDEKRNLKLPYTQREKDPKMVEKIYKTITNEVSKE